MNIDVATIESLNRVMLLELSQIQRRSIRERRAAEFGSKIASSSSAAIVALIAAALRRQIRAVAISLQYSPMRLAYLTSSEVRSDRLRALVALVAFSAAPMVVRRSDPEKDPRFLRTLLGWDVAARPSRVSRC